MRSRKTYSAAYHKKTHDFDLPIYYTVFSRKKKPERHYHNKTHPTELVHALCACNQYVLKQIIALNFISKTHDCDQLITTNPQKKKKETKQKNNTMQCMFTLV